MQNLKKVRENFRDCKRRVYIISGFLPSRPCLKNIPDELSHQGAKNV
jgi:hypothetical protein